MYNLVTGSYEPERCEVKKMSMTKKGAMMKGARPGKSVMGMSIGDSVGRNTGKAAQVMPSKNKPRKG